MIAPLFAAALALAASCDLEHPSGRAGCTRAAVDGLKINALQAVGTHNSYKMAIAPKEMATVKAMAPKDAPTLDYSHAPLTDQLNDGARQLELDLVYDPKGGLYADPLGLKTAGTEPWDVTPLRAPGMKVMHVPDVDYRSVCVLYTRCLAEIRAWSRAHPRHVPILILLNLKEGGLKLPGAVQAPVFDAAAMDAIDAEIRSVFPEAELITPDRVQGRHPTLRAAVAAGAWPTLKTARGKVMFALDAPPDQVARYRGSRKVLEGRAMFVNIEESSPAAGYITLNEPIELSAQIQAAVKAGLMVRTRADADTVEARTNDTNRRTAAFASGAQYVSTDYMQPDLRFGPYQARLPGGGVARPNPVTAPH
ncbi:MAG: phosphatidylinositol-specific phospholipase C1-like protein [Phenylobacterium sp.]